MSTGSHPQVGNGSLAQASEQYNFSKVLSWFKVQDDVVSKEPAGAPRRKVEESISTGAVASKYVENLVSEDKP